MTSSKPKQILIHYSKYVALCKAEPVIFALQYNDQMTYR